MFFDEKSETMSREHITALQNGKFLELFCRVAEHSAFYKQYYAQYGVDPKTITSIDDLSKLPFTKKEMFREHYPYGLLAVPLKEVVRLHASSGTTGKPTVVAYTKNDIDSWAGLIARALTSAGCTDESIFQIAFGYGLFTGGLGIHYGAEKIGATVIPASTGNTQKQITLMKDLQTTMLAATPSYLLHLHEKMESMGVTPEELHLKTAILGAEPWTEEMRQEIQKKLQIQAFDIYGLSEATGPGVAVECEVQNGLHLFEDHFIAEIIDPVSGDVLPPGEKGELVLTSLQKEAMPIIRYRTGDITSLTYEPCSCGRTHVRMAKPSGRSDDMLIIKGVNVFPTQVESILLTSGIANPHYQLVVARVENADVLTIRAEVDDIYRTEHHVNELKAQVHSVLGIHAKIDLLPPFTLERVEGKTKRVLDLRH